MKTLLTLIAFYLLYLFIKGLLFSKQIKTAKTMGKGKGQEAGKDKGEELVRDPACGSYVPVSTAIKANTAVGVLYFCGPACRDKFMASADK